MHNLKLIIVGGLLGLALQLSAQEILPVPRNIQAAYNKGTRGTDGAPGKNYWQNFATYDLRLRFDPATRLVSGEEDIEYTNRSPDTLREILFKLYPNLYKKGSPRLVNIQPEDIGEGVRISSLLIGGALQKPADLLPAGTNWTVPIDPLAPQQTIRFTLNYSYTLNQNSHMRTGAIDSSAWFIAYFFPRIAVYDDLDGWNRHPYLGTQEFYNDFCDFRMAVTVPRDYVVWATGDLTNCAEVLAPGYCQRLAQAESSDGITTIIDSMDLKTGNITTNRPENTFRFEAKNVTDVAVAISKEYLWKSSSLVVDKSTGRRTRVDAVFNPRHRDYYEVIDFARQTVAAMSFRFPRWPFPYSHETIFDGLDQMEYPMMVNDNPVEDRTEAITLTDHEIFHTMFPFYVGTNETKYGWMDEGWATIGEWLISPMIDSNIVDDYGVAPYERAAGTEVDLPITTLTTQEYGTSMFINSYPKPALGYLYVKDLLGDDLFYQALHRYIRDWNGKHPMPYDFFYSMNTGAGRNLNWFWKRWFFDSGVPDLAIAEVSNDKREKSVLVKMKGNKPVPVDLTVTFTDGSTQKIHRSIDVWEKGEQAVEIRFTTASVIKTLTLGSTYVPDVDKTNNRWPVK